MPLFFRRFGRGLRRLRRRRRSVDGHDGLRGCRRSVDAGVCRGRLARASRRSLVRSRVARGRARHGARIERGRAWRCERRRFDPVVACRFTCAREREASEHERRAGQARREFRRGAGFAGPNGQVDPTERTGDVRRANVTRTRGTGRKGHETEANSVPRTTHQDESVLFGLFESAMIFRFERLGLENRFVGAILLRAPHVGRGTY